MRAANASLQETRVLVSGCLPPPLGGMAAFYESLLASSLPGRVNLAFVNTSSQKRSFEQGGRLSLANVFQSVADCWRFARAVRAQRPAIAHIGTAYGVSFLKHSVCVAIARALGSRVVLHPHCSYLVLYADRSPLWKWYFRRVIHLVQGVVALSQEWTALPAVAPHCKVYPLPNAVNLQAYRQVAEGRTSSALETGRLHILYLGHLGKEKGSFELVGAAAATRAAGHPCEFRLIGGELTPGEAAALRDSIRAGGLEEHVQVCPPVTGSEKLAAFRWADVFVYPSYAEGMPMAVIEAMACGLPVIASRVGGLPDLIADGVNGLLVEAGQVEQLSLAILELAREPSLRRSMGQQSYRRAVEEYDFEQRVDQLVGIYTAVLSPN